MQTQPETLARALASEEAKLLACVHCGLCLEACPTYVHTGDENDSPRGRLYLMRAAREGRLAVASPVFERHIDRCLGCRACESACPAGVEYGVLLEAARADIRADGERRSHTGRLLNLVLRHVWLHPARLRLAFATARVLRDAKLVRLLLASRLPRLVSPRLELALALLDSSSSVRLEGSRGAAGATLIDGGTAREGAARSGAGAELTAVRDIAPRAARLFTGCVTEGLFARVNRATARVLGAQGCEVSAPPRQVCCGALHAHAGDAEGARSLARRNVEAFESADQSPVVTNAGGCGAMLKGYAHLLSDDAEFAERAREFSARVRDVSQQLAAAGTRVGAPLDDAAVTTYDASCHLLHGQRAAEEPLRMLEAIPALRFVPLEGGDVCCGGAGVYNLLETGLSSRVLAEKLKHVAESGATLLATGNAGCHMQIAAGARLAGTGLRVCHPVELLDESYRRAGYYEAGTTKAEGSAKLGS
ncbi:MAG TPA: heterodisulfide reductase-related iron-sulfur binding cluster [Pyrinomonadaceae bacterium]|jgi:glycolate oxidase iron-sulfur subunit|nr:heterodisulfide reductase-related iron-sulfur binding cluster [Pyrinomonadaceae bacterium]